MPIADGSPMFWWVLYLGLGGAALGLLCQLLAAREPRFQGVVLPAVLATTFIGLGAVACFTGQAGAVLLSVTGLMAVAAIRWASRLRAPWQAVLELFVRLQAAWLLLLIACIGSAFYLAYNLPQEPAALTQLPTAEPVVPVANDEWHAETDRGSEIPLISFVMKQSPESLEEAVLANAYLNHQVIRVAPPDPSSNCHGWVFTGGRCAVPGRAVDRILSDNRYQRVALPKQGDLIVYRNENGEVEHTGIVEAIGEDGLILIKSKWGAIGLYIHAPEAQPWSNHYAYYRSRRPGHKLKIKPSKNGVMKPGAIA